MAENLAINKNRSSSGTGRSNIDFKVSISVKIQFPSDSVKQKNRKSERFRFFRFWGRFFKIFSPGGVPEGGSIFTILRPKGPNTSKNTIIFQKEFFFIYSPTSLLCSTSQFACRVSLFQSIIIAMHRKNS